MMQMIFAALFSPLLWMGMFFVVPKSPPQRKQFWIALALYLVVAGSIVLKVTVFGEGMQDMYYIVCGGIGVFLYTLLCFGFALAARYHPAHRERILKLSPHHRSPGHPK